jgi:hypothetical protein
MAQPKLFPLWRLPESDVLRRALSQAPGAKITVLDLADVVLDAQADDAVGGATPWIGETLSKVAGGIGRFVVPTAEQLAEGERDEAELARVEAEGGNPYLKGFKPWNITRQLELERSNPKLAAQLKAKAEDELKLYAKALEAKRDATLSLGDPKLGARTEEGAQNRAALLAGEYRPRQGRG